MNVKDTMLEARPTGLRTDNQLLPCDDCWDDQTFRVNAKDTMLEARPTGLRTDNQLSTMS